MTRDYEGVIAVVAREKRQRASYLRLAAPQDEEAIVDIGSGTGTMAIAIKAAVPAFRTGYLSIPRAIKSLSA